MLVLAGVVIYLALLWVTNSLVASLYIPPQWLLDLRQFRPVPSAIWFVLINFLAAALAATPVGLVIGRGIGTNTRALALAVGLVSSFCWVVYGLSEYVTHMRPILVLVLALQFVTTALAVLLVVVLVPSRPLTTRSSGP
jgi:hypothetical protein